VPNDLSGPKWISFEFSHQKVESMEAERLDVFRMPWRSAGAPTDYPILRYAPVSCEQRNDWTAIFNVSSFRTQIIGSQQVAKQGHLSPREKTGGKRWGQVSVKWAGREKCKKNAN
jgi:hypothetical protein